MGSLLKLKCLLIVPVAFLALGVAPQQGRPLVARVATLTPMPYVAAPAQPIIEETVVHVEYTTPPTSAPQRPSDTVTVGLTGGYTGDLSGTIGYARSGGNCVNEPGVKNPGWGNPIDWPIATSQAYLGATALFTYNHVGVVVGIWSNGDLEIRHQNYRGGQHRFPRGAFRGFI